MPDVLGMTLCEAERYLKDRGIAFIVRETAPPHRGKDKEDPPGAGTSVNKVPGRIRVVCQIDGGKETILITCRIEDPFM
ncbi:MAG: PASTA domain-containing protein [Anaerovoracaceae bacterium]|jgi:hypothetical protein